MNFSPKSRNHLPPIKSVRRKDDRINKGVTHKIKKPKITKAKEKRFSQAKKCVSRLKDVKLPPRLAINRSPIGEANKTKKHALTSPGFSLLDSPEANDSKECNQTKNGRKFFTSRSKEAATVQISKAIKLCAINGSVKMTKREGGFEKKNIGQKVELELEEQIAAASLDSPTCNVKKSFSHTLPSMVNATKRPIPTRFPTSPSPRRSAIPINRTPKRNSPYKTSARSSPRQISLKLKLNSPIINSPTRRSPRKLLDTAKSANKSLQKQLNGENISESLSETQFNLSAEEARELQDLDLAFEQVCSAIPDEDKKLLCLLKENATPEKLLEPSRCTPKKPLVERQENVRSSPRLKNKDKSENVKYFPIFNKNRKMIPEETRSKNATSKTKKMIASRGDDSQMVIDAGQKKFGAVYCKSCGLLYEIGNPDDEASHTQYHDSLFSALNYSRWKNENQVTTVDSHGGRIIMVTSNDPSYCWRKVSDVLKCIDEDLGFSENGIRDKENSFVFMYVLKKQIVGCLVAESIDKAFKVIQETSKEATGLLCCSDVPQKVFVGISRIWVLPSERKNKVATKLVDAMRANVMTCHYLKLEDFAFSDPTTNGVSFAEKYSGLSDFLVYRRE